MPVDLIALLDLPIIHAILQIGLIVILIYIAGQGLRLVAHRVDGRLEMQTSDPERLDRLKTLVQLGHTVAYALVLIVSGLMILDALNINIAPLLAGAGVVGLALSLGAQTLIKDFIGGVLILGENQFTKGDVIKVGDIAGGVERISLRATYLRDLEGKLHIVPNGEIRLVSNLTNGWARAVVDVNIPFEENIPKAIHALETAATEAFADETIKADFIEPPQASGWVGLTDWSVKLRLMAKTRPGKQWSAAMSLRRHAMESFKTEGVKMAFPTQRIQLGEGG